MKGFRPFPFIGFAIFFLSLVGCAGKTPQNGPPPLNFVVTKMPDGAVPEPYKQVIVVSGGLSPYTYTITGGSLPPGLSMDSSGVVSGTPTIDGSSSFTVKVVDSQTPIQAYNTANLTITINPPISIPPTSLSNAIVGVPYSGAVVASGGVKPYNYTVTSDPSLVFSSAPGGHALVFNTDGTITGTPLGPIGTFSFTVQVADKGGAVATANLSLAIIGKLQGNYAFSFTGYNNGQPFYMAGSFCADGNGSINPSGNTICPSPGVLDRNGSDATGLVTNVPITGGTYTIGDNNLGTMTLLTANPALNFQYNIAVSTVSDSRFILSDPANPAVWGSGVIKKQTLTSLSLASGNFAFGFSGIDGGGNREAGAGYFVTDASGVITSGNGLADINDNGVVQSQASLAGSLTPNADPATGRGTATFTIGSSTLDYAFYIVSLSGVSGNELLAVQTDSFAGGAPVTLASMLKRAFAGTCSSNFSSLCLNASRGGNPNGAVFELNALTNSVPDISLGLANFDGNGNINHYSLDENNGGVVDGGTGSPSDLTGTYSVDKVTGRVSVSLNGVTNQPVWYLVGFNAGYVVGTDASVTSGVFEPQTVTQPISNLAFFGKFYGGSSNPVQAAVTNEVDSLIATPPQNGSNGTFIETFDSNGPGGILTDQKFTGGFPNPSTDTTRTPILDSTGKTVEILYIVSAGASGATNAQTKAVLLSTDAKPKLIVITH